MIIKSLSQGKICGKLFSTCSVSNMYLWAAFYVSDTLSYHLRLQRLKTEMKWGRFPGGPVVKNLPANAEGTDLIPGPMV